MMLVAFENGILPLPKQHPADMDDWEENEMDSSHILPEEPSTLLPLFQLKIVTKKKCL